MSKNNKSKSKFDKRNKFKSKESKDQKETYISKEDNETKQYKFRNHPSDFIPNEEIRKQVGSFSYNNTIGLPIRLDTVDERGVTTRAFQVPSVMSIHLMSSIGSIADSNSIDGINTSGKKYYNILSSMNAKTTNYQPEDISLVEVLVGDLMGLVANAMRIYGVAFNFNPRNRRVPDDLISAMGIAPDSLASNGDLSAYRMRLNRILTAANGIRFVKDISIFKRSWELYSRIFIDENSSMGQYYVFRPSGYWALNEATGTERAVWVDISTSLLTAQEYLDIIETCVDRLLSSSLFNYIYTDILNYQSKKGAELIGFAYVPEMVQVFGVYDPGILNQIHNMTWGALDTTGYKIIDDVEHNKIYTTNPVSFTGRAAGLSMAGTQILDQIYTDQPTYDDNVDALAFKSVINDLAQTEVSGVYTAGMVYLPDHPVYKVDIYIGGEVQTLNRCSVYSTDAMADVNNLLKALLPFKVAPLLYYIVAAEGAKSNSLGNLNFFTTVEPKQLENMFNYYYLGLYDVEIKDVKEFQ